MNAAYCSSLPTIRSAPMNCAGQPVDVVPRRHHERAGAVAVAAVLLEVAREQQHLGQRVATAVAVRLEVLVELLAVRLERPVDGVGLGVLGELGGRDRRGERVVVVGAQAADDGRAAGRRVVADVLALRPAVGEVELDAGQLTDQRQPGAGVGAAHLDVDLDVVPGQRRRHLAADPLEQVVLGVRHGPVAGPPGGAVVVVEGDEPHRRRLLEAGDDEERLGEDVVRGAVVLQRCSGGSRTAGCRTRRCRRRCRPGRAARSGRRRGCRSGPAA